ncbi:hypothetical protein KUCAC02_013995 [Chaenocephalus aceratus]|uniref:Uncharacterized protein n=1 Tax=Chaenocephalus aceratus TaxID=36190 RepID=A0ACB9WCH3_CHAAC|nr:hypothetical protein KUCAC02_013995 [Chaenocephalus aceratus]
MQTIKCVVFPSEYVPTVFDNYAVTVMIGGEPYTLGLFDTAGQEDYDRLRSAQHPQDGRVPSYVSPAVSPSSFEKRQREGGSAGRQQQPSRRLAKNKQRRYILRAERSWRGKLKAVKYVECSALTKRGLKNVFDEAILAALEPPETKTKRKCVLL